jgi:hypothetical protein
MNTLWFTLSRAATELLAFLVGYVLCTAVVSAPRTADMGVRFGLPCVVVVDGCPPCEGMFLLCCARDVTPPLTGS